MDITYCSACSQPLPELPSDDVVQRPTFDRVTGELDSIELAHRECCPKWGVYDDWPDKTTDTEARWLSRHGF